MGCRHALDTMRLEKMGALADATADTVSIETTDVNMQPSTLSIDLLVMAA